MRRLLCTALLLLCCAYGCIAAVVQPLPKRGQGPWDTYTLSVPGGVDLERKKEGFQPIRFAVSAKEIDRIVKNCEHNGGEWDVEYDDTKDYGFKLNIKEINTNFCDGPNEVTAYRRKTLLREVLPAALKLHSERLSVERVEDMLKLPFNETHPYPVLPNCTDVSIPKDHIKGIPNADFMLYVGLIDEHQPPKICSRNTKGRPTSALIKFVPEEIDATRHYIRFTAHEVAHALGFEIEMMKEHVKEGKETTGKKKVRLVTYPTVIEKMKDQYKCTNDEGDNEITGMALENEFTPGAPLHWERRIAKDELMSTYSGSSNGMFYTALTLAVFDSMPFYKAEFKMAENMSWGKDAGCDFLKGNDKEDYKQTKPNKYSEMFCDEVNPALQCTSDRFSLGMCSMKPYGVKIPLDYEMYFPPVLNDPDDDLMDGYTIIKPIPKTNCEEDKFNLIPGSILSNISRCLKGDKLKLKEPNENNLTVGDICADVKCEKDTKKILVQYSGSEKWRVCEDGKKIEVTGSTEFASGSILCPNYTEVCNDFPEVKDINFTIEYDEDEKERIKKEEEEKDEMDVETQEAEEETLEEEREREKERERDEDKENAKHPEPSPPTRSQRAPQTNPQPNPRENPTSEVTVEHGGSDVANKGNGTSHVPTAPSQAEDQRDSAGGGKEEVALPHPAVPEPQLEREEKQAHENSNNNNTGGLQPQQPTLSAQENSSEPVKKPEVENMPTTETPTPVVSKPTITLDDTASIKEEDNNNKTESSEQVQGTITQPPTQDGNDETKPTVDPVRSPEDVESPSTSDEKRNETIVNTDNNATTSTNPVENAQTETSAPTSTPDLSETIIASSEENIHTTTSSIPENVNASAAHATLTGLNNTRMGQALNQATTIAIVGADSSIATSYQISLLLIVSALVALASP
ncbi:surface protease GP63 [Trypanosoma theileri]|uniref:leishmanolysin n=1 Tax=Trypanosoma theileri TaxID=67003 RepID=A0A1X0NFT1_9TRYP|nr:surface protease GP63 [Trypanosoma theileri]ORC83451.1 surface protease GP63 [Trypanosoma theileri]